MKLMGFYENKNLDIKMFFVIITPVKTSFIVINC